MAKTSVEPKQINDVLIINIGIALWLVGFVVAAFVAGPSKITATCFIGIFLGLWGRRYTVRRRAHQKN